MATDDDDDETGKIRPIRPGISVRENGPLSALDQIRDLLDQSQPRPGPREYSLEELSDENVVKDRGAFRHRFGPGFNWSLHRRESLMDLKAKRRMTDREAKAMRLFGNLVPRSVGIELISSPTNAALAAVILAYLLLIAAGVSTWAISQDRLSVRQFAILVGALISLVVYGYICHLAYLLPWIINRRGAPVKRQ